MKTTITLMLAALVAAFASAQPAPAPEQTSAARQKLEVWLGNWAYESTQQASPLGQAGTYRGSHTVRPILGGQFIGAAEGVMSQILTD